MKVNDLVYVYGYAPFGCHENSVWRITMIAEPYAVVEIVKPWSSADHRWLGELVQVRLTDLKVFEGVL